jgi:hypothetical protein
MRLAAAAGVGCSTQVVAEEGTLPQVEVAKGAGAGRNQGMGRMRGMGTPREAGGRGAEAVAGEGSPPLVAGATAVAGEGCPPPLAEGVVVVAGSAPRQAAGRAWGRAWGGEGADSAPRDCSRAGRGGGVVCSGMCKRVETESLS